MFVILLLLANACKEENIDPDAEFRAGSYLYQVDDNTYFKLQDDSLFKYTPSGKVFVEHTIDSNMNLSSSELNVSGMISGEFFPDENQRIYSLLDEVVLFQAKGKADGVAVFTGDTTDDGSSNRYEDFPYAQGNTLDVYNDKQTDEVGYVYWYPDTFTATLVATNFYYDADPKELTKTITVVIIDPATVPFIE